MYMYSERHRRWKWKPTLHKNNGRKATGNHLPTFFKNMASQIRAIECGIK